MVFGVGGEVQCRVIASGGEFVLKKLRVQVQNARMALIQADRTWLASVPIFDPQASYPETWRRTTRSPFRSPRPTPWAAASTGPFWAF